MDLRARANDELILSTRANGSIEIGYDDNLRQLKGKNLSDDHIFQNGYLDSISAHVHATRVIAREQQSLAPRDAAEHFA